MTSFFRIIFLGLWATAFAFCGEQKPTEEPRSIAAENLKPNEHGKKLFYTKCASCHMVNKEMTGPALRGVASRWPDKEKLYAFIRNSEEIIRKDKYARELWLEWNQTAMTPHPDLTDEDIAALLQYIESVSE